MSGRLLGAVHVIVFIVTVIMKTKHVMGETSDVARSSQIGDYCVPDAWQATRFTSTGSVDKSGKYSINRGWGYVYYSSTLQKMSIGEASMDGGDYKTEIYDFPSKTLYTVIGDKTCTKSYLPGPFSPQCVPANSNVTLSDSYYGVGNNKQLIKELSGTQNGIQYKVSVTYTNIPNLPILEELWGGLNGMLFYKTLKFNNFTIGPVPDIKFKPSSICNSALVTQIKTRDTVDMGENFQSSPIFF